MTNHEHELQRQMFEAFKKFSDIYRSKVELTGETIRKIDPFSLPMDPSQSIKYKETQEISIKMPQDEFERFMLNWQYYIDVMYACQDNPVIQKEFHKVLMMSQLSK
jgi:hypothetical protein